MTRSEQNQVRLFAMNKLNGDSATIRKDSSVWVYVTKCNKVWLIGFAGYAENLLSDSLNTISR